MLTLFFGSLEAVNTDTDVSRLLTYDQAQGKMSIYWDHPDEESSHMALTPGGYQEIGYLDTLVVYDLTVGILHFLKVNIDGGISESGDTLIEYHPPNPPEIHEYAVYVFEQEFYIDPSLGHDIDRYSFDLEQFAETYELIQKESAVFSVEPDPPLPEREVKYCHCVQEVKAKGSAYNPFAVCAKSVGTTSRRCREIE